MSEQNDRQKFLTAFGIYGAIGFQLALSVVAGLWFGNYCDDYFGTTPWLMVTGLMLGSAAGFWNLIKLLKWNENRGKKD